MSIIGPSDYVLEAVNLYYTGHVEPPTWMKQVTGTIRSGMILRDVSFEVHSGEIMAILGSKGSGKKALLDVIACRSAGVKKGYVLLNGVNINRRLFETAGSYLSGMNDRFLQPGITVYQTLYHQTCLSLNVPASVRKGRVRQIMSDIAMTQAAGMNVDKLSASERRRLSIGVQLIKDPVVLLADEPAWNLDPLNTYFIVSILSNYAKKYGRLVILTMEKPRSDIFPFLDRVTYLCLGDVVYSGNTRLMLDYFRTIGFPCPEVENPLMYYLCLAFVDRRSHEKFIESNNQIGLLVDKFKLEGNGFRKGGFNPGETRGSVTPLHALGTPSVFSKILTFAIRNLSTTFLFTLHGLQQIFFRMIFMPFLFFILWVFYFGKTTNLYQHSYVTQNGLVLNTLALTYFAAIWSTIMTYQTHRYRYYQETREGLYFGTTFIFAYSLASLPLNAITCLIASRILHEMSGLTETTDWLLSFSVMLTLFLLAQQHTLGALLTIKNRIFAAAALVAFHSLTIALSSGTVRTLRALPDWLYYITYVTQPRYAGAFLNQLNFEQFNGNKTVPIWTGERELSCSNSDFGRGCRYMSGKHYLHERYYHEGDRDDLNFWLNFGLSFGFPVVAFLINIMVYTMPLPLLVKNKFRE